MDEVCDVTTVVSPLQPASVEPVVTPAEASAAGCCDEPNMFEKKPETASPVPASGLLQPAAVGAGAAGAPGVATASGGGT